MDEITFKDGSKVIFTKTQGDVWYSASMDSEKWDSPKWFGIDWCAGNGFIRGEVIKKDENVIYVRFKTLELDD